VPACDIDVAGARSAWFGAESLVAKNHPGPTWFQGICARVPVCPAARPDGDAAADELAGVPAVDVRRADGADVADAVARGAEGADPDVTGADVAGADDAAADGAGEDGPMAAREPLPPQAVTRAPTTRTPTKDRRAVRTVPRTLMPTSHGLTRAESDRLGSHGHIGGMTSAFAVRLARAYAQGWAGAHPMHQPTPRALRELGVVQGRGMRFRIVSWVAAVGSWLLAVSSGVTAAAQTAGADAQLRPPLPAPLAVTRSFAPPPHPWAAGNRGVDLAAHAGERVSAATAGLVIYAGLLAGRGVISIRDGSLRTTYEPVDPVVHPGDTVVAGQFIGYVSAAADSCGSPGTCLHWGVLQSDEYIDPMGLLRAPRVRLLPIWSG
jgi:murein DD-endopeptidase MepM/ murein hydrolase activator NlpD